MRERTPQYDPWVSELHNWMNIIRKRVHLGRGHEFSFRYLKLPLKYPHLVRGKLAVRGSHTGHTEPTISTATWASLCLSPPTPHIPSTPAPAWPELPPHQHTPWGRAWLGHAFYLLYETKFPQGIRDVCVCVDAGVS